jgi:hypothetical protein
MELFQSYEFSFYSQFQHLTMDLLEMELSDFVIYFL